MNPSSHYDTVAANAQLYDKQWSGLRCINNRVKALLIQLLTQELSPDKTHFLDVCCGRGGDIKKWDQNRELEVLGIDLSRVSVQEANNRAKNTTHINFNAVMGDVRFELANICGKDNWDGAALHFCLNYIWDKKEDFIGQLQSALIDHSYVSVIFTHNGILENAPWDCVQTTPGCDGVYNFHLGGLVDAQEHVLQIEEVIHEFSKQGFKAYKLWCSIRDAFDDLKHLSKFEKPPLSMTTAECRLADQYAVCIFQKIITK